MSRAAVLPAALLAASSAAAIDGVWGAAARPVGCLAGGRQGAVAVVWRGAVLVVGGSGCPFPCCPSINVTHYADVLAAPDWRVVASFGAVNGTYGRTHHAAAVLGDTLYMIGGYGGVPPRSHDTVVTLDLADPAHGAAERAPLLGGPRTSLAAAVLGGRIITVGGWTSTGASADVMSYDAASDTWTSLAPMPTARGAVGLAAAGHAPLLYAVGGFKRSGGDPPWTPLADVEAYDPREDAWSVLAPLPSARQTAAAVTLPPSVGGLLAVVGGFNGTRDICYKTDSVFPRDLLVLDEQGTWSARAALPTRRGFLAAAVANATLVTAGGVATTGDSGAVETLDLRSWKWEQCTAPKMPPSSGTGVADF